MQTKRRPAGFRHATMRRMNEIGVLRALRAFGPLARVELAEHLELDAKTLTTLGQDLIERRFIEPAGQASVGRARPREMLRIP